MKPGVRKKKTKKQPLHFCRGLCGIRQRPTLPGRLQPSTIGAERLNFCVRYGNRWIPFAVATGIVQGLYPENRTSESPHLAISPFGLFFALSLEQVLGRLVSPSSNPYGPSTDDLSPGCLPGALLPLGMGHFVLRWASRLDAFSVYPIRISLPCCAVGTTTVAPVMRPFRSSRTRNSSSHDSYAHDG